MHDSFSQVPTQTRPPPFRTHQRHPPSQRHGRPYHCGSASARASHESGPQPRYVTQSDKAWARRYPAIGNLIVHTIVEEDSIPEEVDSIYCVKNGQTKTVLAIGEMKRNLISTGSWQGGNINSIPGQQRLSKELRRWVSPLALEMSDACD